MHKLFTALLFVMAGTLAACTGAGDAQTTEPAGSPVSTPVGQSPGASPDAASASAECRDAFAPLAEMEVSSITELGDSPEEVEATIEDCESVDEWIAAADEVIDEDVNPNTAVMLLGIHCEGPSLSNTAICEELASS